MTMKFHVPRIRLAYAIAISAGMIVATTAIAFAYPTLNGSHWPSSSIEYHDITTNYSSEVATAASQFNLAVSNLTLSSGSSGSEIQIADNNYGAVGWFGDCDEPPYPWTSTAYIDFNDYYMSMYSPYSKRRAAVSHELGHCAGGLAHNETDGRIMQHDISEFYDEQGVDGIDPDTSDDIDDFFS